MLTNSDIGVTQIAHRLDVSPATLYTPTANRECPGRLRTALYPKGRRRRRAGCR